MSNHENLDNIFTHMRRLISGRDWAKVADFIKSYDHPDAEIDEVKTVLVITKGLRDIPEIKNVRDPLVTFLENKTGYTD